MTHQNIAGLRQLMVRSERKSADAERIFLHEDEHFSYPDGISVVVPIHNGASEMSNLFLSLKNQSLHKDKFEVIFSLNGCSDESRAEVDEFSANSGVSTVVIEAETANVARARNEALKILRFRFATFLDHDDFLSRDYLEECVNLGDYRSVIVSNIIKVEDGELAEDYAQSVIIREFAVSNIYAPDDISMCYRAYTLNAIKTAPSYMLRRVSYDESLPHSEDVKYWRDLFHAFTPITIKSPTRRDIYYRTVTKDSLSRRPSSFYDKAKPRFAIIDSIHSDKLNFRCDSPQRKFDDRLEKLLMDTLFNLGRG